VKKYVKLLCLILGIFWICSCASQPISSPETKYEKESIHLKLRSDPKLNFNSGMPHTLQVCVYQLRDPNAYNQLANDEDGLYQLLECSLFDMSVVSSKRLTVHPGRDLKISLDRAEDAKYVAVVAGYYLIRKERITRLFEIPVVEKRRGFMLMNKYSTLGNLTIELMLGPKQIHSSRSEQGKPEEEKQEEEKTKEGK
jgi:type VI secretion system VasD/TssJ family lipoprotein